MVQRPSSLRGRPVSAIRIVVLAAVALLAAAALSPSGRMAILSILLLPHFFPGSVPRPLRQFSSAPSVSTIQVPGAPGSMVADIYWPAGQGPHPAIVLLLGVNPLPREHEQVTTLAEGIARTGLVTVVAESDALVAGEIRAEEIDNLVALFNYLERNPAIDPARIGFAGFCIGAVLELLAASDPRIADRVAYVNAFSVYADTLDVLRAVLSEAMPGPGGPAPWTPDPLTRSVFTRHAIAALPSADDRALLSREFLESAPLSPPEIGALTSLGGRLRDLFRARDPERIDALLLDLPPDFLDSLQRLSPGKTIQRLRATTFIMHDESDTYLPVSGARRLASLLPPETGAHYTEFRLFKHVVPEGVEDPLRFTGEMLKLFGHVNNVLYTAHTGRGRG